MNALELQDASFKLRPKHADMMHNQIKEMIDRLSKSGSNVSKDDVINLCVMFMDLNARLGMLEFFNHEKTYG